MKYILNPEDLQVSILEKKITLMFGSITHMYTMKVEHIPTGICSTHSSTNIESSIKQCIEDMEWKVYFHQINNNKYNNLGGEK